MKLGEAIEKFRVWGFAGVCSWAVRKVEYAIQRRRLRNLALRDPGGAAEKGITFIADLSGRAALSKTARDFVLNLKDAGIPCQTYDLRLKPQIPACDLAGIVTPAEEFRLGRYSHIVSMYRSPLEKSWVPGRVFARIVFHDSAHGIHSTMPYIGASGDDVIAMSDFNYEYFRKAFPGARVFKITYPFRFRLPEATPGDVLRRKYGLRPDDFAVYFNFDFGSYYRKNIPAALKAFQLAFGGDTSAKLVFKTKGAEENRARAAEMASIVKELGIEKEFIHIPDYLPRADLDGLAGMCNVYLSLHKSEGFGIGMAEAMAQGKCVVATNWSANTEFCTPDTSWPVPARMTPILPHEYPPSMVEWAEADVEAAARALRFIRENPAAAAEKAAKGRDFMASHFSLAAFRRDVDAFLLDNRL